MTLVEALELVIVRTGVERYRYLCLEHPNPAVRAEYSALVQRLATEPASPDRARLSRWLWHARYVNAYSGQPNPGDAAVAGVVCEVERK